ncbi:MAG: hypothetical protein D6823_03220 [Chloroflexi bacterium]|jgi:hypothetical protein|nr:MAG: hypothetical protein D6823_03220 [Chloroflexota bacterium]
MKWQLPDPEEVRHALDVLARAKAKVEQIKLDIDIFEAEQARKHGASTARGLVRKYGTTDEDFQQSLTLRTRLLEAMSELYAAQATVDYLNYCKDMYRAEAYAAR